MISARDTDTDTDLQAERRRLSHRGLLDSAISLVAQLTSASDLAARGIASRALSDLQKLRHDMPTRRQFDLKTRHR